MGNFYSLCLLHLPCHSLHWALFWYINKLVPSGKEATVLLNVYPVFVSKFNFNIRQHSTVDRRAYYNATQNVFVV